jgi:hypothetical protein
MSRTGRKEKRRKKASNNGLPKTRKEKEKKSMNLETSIH